MTYFPKPIGGAEVAIKEITDRISEDDIEFHLISLRFDSDVLREEQLGNIHVHRIGFTKKGAEVADFRRFPLHLNKLMYQFSAPLYAWRLHRRHHFDAVWGVMAHGAGVPSALFKLFFSRVGYVLTLQEGDPLEHIESKMRFFGPLFTRAFTSADVVQAISTFLGTWATKKGYRGEPVVIPNGINARRLTDVSPRDIEAAKHTIGKTDGEVWLIHTGRYVRKNGLDTVVRALSELPDNVHALLIGEGPDAESLRKLTTKLKLESRVHFLPFVNAEELPKYLKACDIFIRPSRSEGMGISFIEAMAAGIPVIATHVGGITDFLFDEKRNLDRKPTGWAVDVDDPTSIKKAVENILSDTAHSREVCEVAQRMAVGQYDWAPIAKRMRDEVFQAVLEERT